jgi:GABA(A) receptor-associated protein
MVPIDLTLAQFIYVIRKRMKLNPEMVIILLINDTTIISPSNIFTNVYEKYKDEDGFLYIKYSFENTFGKYI